MLNKWMLGCLISYSCVANAGMMETVNFSGFWGGIGGSYTNTKLERTNQYQSSI